MSPNREQDSYSRIIESIFLEHYHPGDTEVSFTRADIIQTASRLNISLPKNVGDVIYSFRFRRNLPDSITQTAPEGWVWIIRLVGRGLYRFVLSQSAIFSPSSLLAQTKILDATPGLILKYAFSDEQALLAILRYNRLIDIFTGLTCYSLQNHLRTTVEHIGQVETDEIYIGVDKKGSHYALPVQAKSGSEKIGVVQIEQDFALCQEKLPGLICRAIAAQFMSDRVIALFEFSLTEEGVRIVNEKHYKLVPPEDLSDQELIDYQSRPLD